MWIIVAVLSVLFAVLGIGFIVDKVSTKKQKNNTTLQQRIEANNYAREIMLQDVQRAIDQRQQGVREAIEQQRVEQPPLNPAEEIKRKFGVTGGWSCVSLMKGQADILEKLLSKIGITEYQLFYMRSVSGLGYSYHLKVIDQGHARSLTNFYLEQLPGCCGIVVSNGVNIYPEYRRKGLGATLNALRISIAKVQGYGMMLCTDVDTNEAQKKILSKNGWKKVDEFINPKTQNRVNIHTIEL
jgi:hypothetical protein